MKIKSILFLILLIGRWKYTQQHVMLTLQENKNEVIEEHNRIFKTSSTPLKNWKSQSDYKECTTWCIQDEECSFMNVIIQNGILECFVYQKDTIGEFESQNGVIFISKREQQCSVYCKELSYMNVCGPCKCVDLCINVFQYYCDCTNARSNPLEDCSNPIETPDGNVAALYNLNGWNGTRKVMCQSSLLATNDDLWLTILRKHNPKQDSLKIEVGLGFPYEENYFIGFKELAYLFRNKDTTTFNLRVDLLTRVDNHYLWAEYDNVNFWKKPNGHSFLTPETKKEYSCYKIGFHISMTTNFRKIFRADHRTNANKWFYAQTTFLLQTQKKNNTSTPTPPIPDEGFIPIKNQLLGYNNYFGYEFCLSFEFKLLNDGAQHHILITNEVWISLEKQAKTFYYRFPKHMNTWDYKEQPAQALNTWHRVEGVRFKRGDSYMIAVYFNDKLLFEAGVPAPRVSHGAYEIRLAEKGKTPCRMRNLYINGVKYA